MNFLLDTSVVSEWVRPHPNENVVRWLAQVDEDRTYLSVVTFAEIRTGVDAMAPGRRRELLKTWLEADLLARFEGRILGVDLELAQAWGALMARRPCGGYGQRDGRADCSERRDSRFCAGDPRHAAFGKTGNQIFQSVGI